MTTTLSASVVPENEIDALNNLQASLPEGSELGKVLEAMSEGLRSGAGVTVARDDDQVTPARAAAILGISRTHLYKILDAGLIPFHIVGERDRRMFMGDVRDYLTQSVTFRAADATSIGTRQQLEDAVFDAME